MFCIRTSALAPLVVALAVSGCSLVAELSNETQGSSQKTDTGLNAPGAQQPTIELNRRDAVVVQHNGRIGGAALRPGERQHVLYFSDPSFIDRYVQGASTPASQAVSAEAEEQIMSNSLRRLEEMNAVKGTAASPATSTSSDTETDSSDQSVTTTNSREATGYSYYEISRWTRYCQGNASSTDIAFIKRTGGHKSLPAFMRNSCKPRQIL